MGFAGFYGEMYFDPAYVVIDCMSAIVILYTNAGFVLAADGRASRVKSNAAFKDNVTKIFDVSGNNRTAAMTITGTVWFTESDKSDEIVLDLVGEATKAAASLRHRSSKNLLGFATRIGAEVNAAIFKAQQTYAIHELPSFEHSFTHETGATIARIFICGFSHGNPERLSVRLSHIDQRLQRPEVTRGRLDEGVYIGSACIAKLVLHGTKSDPLPEHRVAEPLHSSSSIAAAYDTARKYIEACSDPRAEQIDPRTWGAIGGQFHAASITRSEGFVWM